MNQKTLILSAILSIFWMLPSSGYAKEVNLKLVYPRQAQVAQLDTKSADYYNTRGADEGNAKNYKAALADFTRAINLKPDFAVAYGNRGVVYYSLGDNKSALSDYSEAIKIKPDFAKAYYDRGLVYHDLGNKSAALSDFEKARDIYKSQGNTKGYDSMLHIINSLR